MANNPQDIYNRDKKDKNENITKDNNIKDTHNRDKEDKNMNTDDDNSINDPKKLEKDDQASKNTKKKDQILEGTDDKQDESSEESDVEVLLESAPQSEKTYSIWSLDEYFYSIMEDWNPLIVYFIELVIVFIILFLPSVAWLKESWKTIDLKKYFNNPGPLTSDTEGLFRISLFTFIWYAFDIAVKLITKSILVIAYLIFSTLQLNESEFCWSMADILYTSRSYIRLSADCLFVFFLSIKMFSKYSKPKNFNILMHNVQITLVLWVGIYTGMIFLMKLITGILVYDIKNASFKSHIRDLNQKLFIFKKMVCISEADTAGDANDIMENMIPEYDPGFYPREKKLFHSSKEVNLMVRKLLVRLGVKSLKYQDVSKYFPKDGDSVFMYLTSADAVDKNTIIKRKMLIGVAAELYMKRKDMVSTLRDRDTIFKKLEFIFWLGTTYLAAIILCILFDINYSLYLVGIGTSFVTFSWIFADVIKMIFHCFVFVLILRPYSIGDTVNIDDEDLVVSKIDLLTTTFVNITQTITYMSNITLMATKIRNFSRSPPQSLLVEVKVGDVKYTKLKSLESSLKKNVQKVSKHFTNAEFLQLADGKALFSANMVKNSGNIKQMKARKDKMAKILEQLLQSNEIPFENSYLFKMK